MKVYRFQDYGDIRDMFYAINPNHSKVCTLFTGYPGSGKTACSASCGSVNMSRSQKRKYKHACEKIDYLNNFHRAELTYPPEEHLVFCSGFKISTRNMTSYDFDAFRIGLNDRMFATIYFPMHSLRIIDEIQSIYPSQQDSGIPKIPLRVSTEFQKARHYDIYTIGTAQIGTDINKKLRDISSFFVVQKMTFKYSKAKRIVKTKYHCLYFVNHSQYIMYLDAHEDPALGESIILEDERNIFKHYCHTSCEIQFDEVDNKFCSYDQSYSEPNSITPPDGYGGSKQETKKETKRSKKTDENNQED